MIKKINKQNKNVHQCASTSSRKYPNELRMKGLL
jgi:hypothetical protein